MHSTHLRVHIYASTKYYKKKKKSNHYEVVNCTRILLGNSFKGEEEKNKATVVLLAYDTPTWPMFLPNIIKLPQTLWELFPTQDFGFRGDNYKTKKVWFVHVTRQLVFIYKSTKYYQNISKYQEVMVRRKIWLRISFKVSLWWKTVRVFSLAYHVPMDHPLHPYRAQKECSFPGCHISFHPREFNKWNNEIYRP